MIHDYPQGSEQWERIRKGKATASELGRILTPAKLQFASGAVTYAAEKVAEILGVETVPPPPTFWMVRGTELEPHARREVSQIIGVDVQQVGFIMRDDDARFGASVDGLIGHDAILELKCPMAETLILWHNEGVVPKEFKLQIQGGLHATDRLRALFVGWHPEIEPLVLWVDRDNNIIGKIEDALVEFYELMDSMLAKVKSRTASRLMTQYQAKDVAL